MVARLWKKVCFLILIVACMFNIVNKIVKKMPYKEELRSSAQYIADQEKEDSSNENK